MNGCLVGQAPARSSRPGSWPLDGPCGRRLARLAGLSGYDELTAVFAVANLLPEFPGKDGKGDRWPIVEARSRAAAMLPTLLEFDRVLLLGRHVAEAFGVPARRKDFLEWFVLDAEPRAGEDVTWAAVFPHPSGVSHWWNDPGNLAAAEGFLRRLVDELAPFDVR